MSLDSIVEHVHRLLLDNLPPRTKHTASHWLIFNCPLCTDKRQRAGIIKSGGKISFNCFNCHMKASWSPGPILGNKYRVLAKAMGASDKEIHEVKLELLRESGVFDNELPLANNYEYKSSKFEVLDLPANTIQLEDLPDEHPVKQYAMERGILGLYPLLHVNDVQNRKRVTVPYIYNGELVGWTARHIHPPNKLTPKYMQRVQPGYVFNIDRFAGPEREIVIVSEGVIDAILIDGVSVLGNTLSPGQEQMINNLSKRVILCPHRDIAGKELIEQATKAGWEVSFPPWASGCKDAANACARYGRLLTIESIIKYAISNKTKIKVKTRIM